jgi:hypothetical protein
MLRVRVSLARVGLLAVVCAFHPAQAELLGEEDLAEVVRKPAIGLYKGYAEFKMAHYAEAKQIWTAEAAPSAPASAPTQHGGSPCRGKPRPRS